MLYSITILVALIGNLLLIFIIKRRPETRSLTGFLFVNMAVADLLVTLVAMPVSLASLYTGGTWPEGMLGHVTCTPVYFTFFVTLGASIFSLLLMSVDRYFAVAFPLRRFGTFRRARVLSVVIWLSAMIFSIPVAIVWRLYASGPFVLCGPKFDILGEFGETGYYTYLFLLMYLIPLIMMSTLYSLVCRSLWLRSTPGEVSSETEKRNQKTKRRVVRMLVIITAAFALCWFPTHFYHLILAFRPEVHGSSPPYVMFLCFWFGHANSAVNPWLYMTLNEKFRRALIDTVHRRDSRFSGVSNRIQSTTKYTTIKGASSLRAQHANRKQASEETGL